MASDNDNDDIPMDELFARNRRVPICMVAAMFAQGLSHNMVFAHLEDLNVDFGHPNTRASLGSAFLGANGVANLFWGQICDKYGQRAGILCSLLFQSVGSLVMCRSATLTTAIVGRALCGISANVTLTRAYVGRTSNATNQARAYSWIIGAFGAAVSTVPLCAWIADQDHIGSNSASVTSAIVSLVSWVTLALCWSMLPYLHPASPVAAPDDPGRDPVRTWADVRDRTCAFGRALCDHRLCFVSAFSYSAATFLLQAPDHVIITQTVQRPALKWLFSIQGLARMLWTLFVYPHLCDRFNVVNVVKASMAMMMLTVPGVYLTSFIANDLVRYGAEALVFAARGINLSMGLTGGAVLVNNASPARLRTTITGLSQSAASLSQTANVTVLALILDEAQRVMGVPFLYLTLSAVAAAFVAFHLPDLLRAPIHDEKGAVKPDLEMAPSFSAVDPSTASPQDAVANEPATPDPADRQRL